MSRTETRTLAGKVRHVRAKYPHAESGNAQLTAALIAREFYGHLSREWPAVRDPGDDMTFTAEQAVRLPSAGEVARAIKQIDRPRAERPRPLPAAPRPWHAERD